MTGHIRIGSGAAMLPHGLFDRGKLPLMKRILSEVLRREDGVVQRNRRAGALRIEFIERSRNESLGIECVFAVSGGDCAERTDRPLDGVAASGAKTRDTYGRLEK